MECLAFDYFKNYKPSVYEYRNIMTVKEMMTLVDDNHNVNSKSRVLEKLPKINNLLYDCVKAEGTQEPVLNDIDCCATLSCWNMNKQIFKCDKDFLDALMKTETLHFTKGCWNYLPCNCFFVDWSDNDQLCSKLNRSGVYIRLNKGAHQDVWQIHTLGILKSDLNTALMDMWFAWDRDKDITVDNFDGLVAETERLRAELDPNYTGEGVLVYPHIDENEKRPALLLFILVCQILTYLSSAEPDISKNGIVLGVTNPVPVPNKNKKKRRTVAGRIQAWDVGVRFGNAFRKWQDETNDAAKPKQNGKINNARVRPHYRRAHWHSFWYGKTGEERIKRVKWVHGMFVNAKSGETLPSVIHEVG